MDLFQHSINVILENQHPEGAYVASPTFATYHFCWLRDGSFIAYSMDRVGQYASAESFYRWVGRTIKRYAGKVDVLDSTLQKGEKPDHRAILNTRFTLEGFEEERSDEGEWGNFQVDGYGSWLWGLAEHVKMTGDTSLLLDLVDPIEVSIRYLQLVWQLPNYDCWEEHPEYLHPYSLASIYGGLAAIAELESVPELAACARAARDLAGKVKDFLAQNAIHDGRFIKHLTPAQKGQPAKPVLHSGVDSSLLGLTIPYGVFDLNDTAVEATIQAIEKDLHLPDGGVYRYKDDVYYGGGEWILLTAWLGWYYVQIGKKAQAEQMLKWIESTAASNGDLAEQVSARLLAPEHFQPWVEKWGPVASPLLWSHAMVIILQKAIED
jgi:GH15 family glucan-1,4-alpha-glucosidase